VKSLVSLNLVHVLVFFLKTFIFFIFFSSAPVIVIGHDEVLCFFKLGSCLSLFLETFIFFFFFNVFSVFIIILYNKNKVFLFYFYIFFYLDAFRMAEMYPNFVKKVVQGRSQYSQVEESGKPCADLWRNPWRAAAGLAMLVYPTY